MDSPDIAFLERYAPKRCSPFGAAEQRQFDGQLKDDHSIEVLVYRKTHFYAVTREQIIFPVLDSAIKLWPSTVSPF
jgi:hypothetical protein